MAETSPNSSESISSPEIPEGAIPRTDPREPLTQKQITAVQLKFAGQSYEEISELIETPANTIRSWFVRGKPCYGAYWRLAKEMTHQANKEALMSFQKGLKQAIEAIQEVANDKEAPAALRLRANMYIVDTLLPRVDAEQKKREEMIEYVGKLGLLYNVESWDEMNKILLELEIAEDHI